MIDDGSVDKSGEICDACALKDKRIKVIHKKNGGVSAARNTGLQEARGEYITYADSDDLVGRTIYTELIDAMEPVSYTHLAAAFTKWRVWLWKSSFTIL